MHRHEIEDALYECTTHPLRGCRITDRAGRELLLRRGTVQIHNKAYVYGESGGEWAEVRKRDISKVEVLS